MPRKTKLQKSEKHRQLIKGVKKHWMKQGTLIFACEKFAPTELVDRLQSFIDEQEATARKRAEWRAQVKRERALEKELAPLVSGVESRVLAQYGQDARELSDFGIRRGKPGPKSLPVKVAMVEKARATRIARGTKGKRQRLKIKARGD